MLVLVAVAVWRLWRTGEDAVGAVQPSDEAALVKRSTPKVAVLVTAVDAGAVLVPSSKNTVVRFGWGSGVNELGRDRPAEGNPEAPMSVTVDSKGNAWVLDQVNKRLVRVDKAGQRLASVPLPLQAAQDVAVAPDGTSVVLDRLVDKSVAIIDADGVLKGELPLIGKGMREGGASTGVFIDGDSVVVERAHGDSVRLGSMAGVRDEKREEVPGRPTRDGQAYLTASLAKGRVLLTVIDSPTRAHRFTREYTLQAPASALVLLDSDRRGVLYLGAMVAPAAVTVLCLDARDGHPLGQVQLPANTSADETFREFAVSDDGEIYSLLRSEEGAELRRASCSAL